MSDLLFNHTNFMMKYYGHGFEYGGMMGSSIICSLISAVVFIDLVLLGIWLWKKIENEKSRNHKSE